MFSLRDRLEKDNEYFKQKINLIPAKYYFDQTALQHDSDDEEDERDHQTKSKRRRITPTQHKTVTDILSEQAENDELDSSSSEEEIVNSEAEEAAENERVASKKKFTKLKPISVDKVKSSDSIVDLRNRLHTKMEELRQKRKAPPTSGNEEASKRKKRKEQKERKMRNQKKDSEQKFKLKVEPEKKPQGSSQSTPAKDGKPILNNQGQVVFSKFDFTGMGEKKKSRQPKGKDYKRLLERAEEKKKKLQELQEKDPERAKEKQEKIKWSSLVDRVEGVKVRDDPTLLKKSLKRKEKRKEASKRKWTDRNKTVEKLIERKQQKRTANIQDRREKKVGKKIERAKKKGRILPGF